MRSTPLFAVLLLNCSLVTHVAAQDATGEAPLPAQAPSDDQGSTSPPVADPAPALPPPPPVAGAGTEPIPVPVVLVTPGGAVVEEPIKPFPLLSRGIIIGGAVAAHFGGTRVGDSDAPVLVGPATGFLAYVGFLRGFWRKNVEETNAYCASYADDAARDRSSRLAYSLTYPGSPPKKPTQFTQQEKNDIRNKRNWDVDRPARCGFWRQFGPFVARPAAIEGNIRLTDDADPVSGKARPLVAAGVMFAWPRPYTHLLLGVTYSNFVGADQRDHRSLSYFVAIGTAIDVVGNLFK